MFCIFHKGHPELQCSILELKSLRPDEYRCLHPLNSSLILIQLKANLGLVQRSAPPSCRREACSRLGENTHSVKLSYVGNRRLLQFAISDPQGIIPFGRRRVVWQKNESSTFKQKGKKEYRPSPTHKLNQHKKNIGRSLAQQKSAALGVNKKKPHLPSNPGTAPDKLESL